MLDDTQGDDGAVKSPLPNLLQRTHEVQGDRMLYRFGNGPAHQDGDLPEA